MRALCLGLLFGSSFALLEQLGRTVFAQFCFWFIARTLLVLLVEAAAAKRPQLSLVLHSFCAACLLGAKHKSIVFHIYFVVLRVVVNS